MMKKTALFFIFFCTLFSLSFAQTADSPAVSRIIADSFALDGQDAVIASLSKAAGKQAAAADRKRILAALAGYEERLGLLDDAVTHYNDAALALPVRDDVLLLDAARCALSANDTAKADSFVQVVLLTGFDERILLRARVYAAWVQLASGNRANAFGLLRSYIANDSFAEFMPAMLFTLWWADNDGDARTRLLSSYPRTPEAALLRGEMSLSPSPYWFLMGRSESLVAAFNGSAAVFPAVSPAAPAAGTAAAAGTPVSAGSAPTVAPAASTGSAETAAPVATAAPAATTNKAWQQAGFFRNREYAEELAAQLKKKGFVPTIRSETRPSGTVYFSVLVPEDALRTTGTRLKDAGFESYLLTE